SQARFLLKAGQSRFLQAGRNPLLRGAGQVSMRTLLRGATLILGNLKLGLDFLSGMCDNL
ncbi:MAG: hypothetical protein LUG25_06550, partial [Oscillospiraceae bacterium]|nr:hypothetical protein [Oscillospiraceae bacterium]